MIVLAVRSYNGAAADPLEARFDEAGGTVGRSDANLLVLPDPDRTVSRVHAAISWRADVFYIEDRGSNPVLHNGAPLGQGQLVPLAHGDELQIGGYCLDVRGDAPAPDLPVSAPQAALIPDDWDPFATLSSPDAAPPSPAGPEASQPQAGPESSPPAAAAAPPVAEGAQAISLDDLFGLGGADPLSPTTVPAVASHVAAPAVSAATPQPAAEPLPVTELLTTPGPAPLPADLDLDFDLTVEAPAPPAVLPATPPAMPPSAPLAAAAEPASSAEAAAELASRSPVVSWDSPRQVTILAPSTTSRRNGGHVPVTQSGGTRPGLRNREAPPPVQPTAPDELLQALIEGLGTGRSLPVTQLTPGLMRLLGSLLAESVAGTIELLRTRATAKSQMRADVTAIRPRQNNPLKFSPTPEVALQHLLTPSVPGFLPARPAVRDAFRDLRAHEEAVMAAMRASVAALLQHFDPRTLESQLVRKTGLGSLLAGGRRAQLWDAYQALFAQLSTEAEDDFHSVYGRAFLKAYETQLAALQAAERAEGAGAHPAGDS